MFIKIDPKNPINNTELVELLKLRRKCHKLFDMIGCQVVQDKSLLLYVVRECYFRVD